MDLLRHLRFFVRVAETRHFGQAAASLGMTQPPLSQGVQRLERDLGVRLFDRDARGVRVTAAGQALLPRAEALLDAADDLRSYAAGWTAPEQVRIGFAGDLEGRIPRLVAALTATGVAVRPVVEGSTALVDAVRDGDLDLAVVRHPGVVDGTRPREVRALPTRLVAAGPGSAHQDEPVRLARVGLPLVVPPRRHQPAAHDQLVDALRREGHSGATLEEADPAARAALVAAGLGVGLSPDPERGAPLARDPLPLRVRVVLPVPAERHASLDLGRVADTLDAALADAAGDLG